MAKQKFERTKPHINIGTIGHVDPVSYTHLKQELTVSEAVEKAIRIVNEEK